MKRFGAQTYPDTIDGIVNDIVLVKVFYKHLIEERSPENLQFYLSPFNPELIYPAFIGPAARSPLNISSAQRKPMDALAARGDWEHIDWVKLMSDAKREVSRLMETDALPRFFRSELFLARHEKLAGSRDDQAVIVPNPPVERWRLAAIEFGIKNAELLKAYIPAFEAKGETLTMGACRRILKSAGKTMEPVVFNRLLVARSFAKKSADLDADPYVPPEDEIDPLDAPADLDPDTGEPMVGDASGMQAVFNKVKLKACGFTLVTRDEDLRALSDMVCAHVVKDPDAKRMYIQIQKAEKLKKNEAIEGITFDRMMKKMREEKAYTLNG